MSTAAELEDAVDISSYVVGFEPSTAPRSSPFPRVGRGA